MNWLEKKKCFQINFQIIDFKQLNKEELLQFNQQIMVESEWFIDRFELLLLIQKNIKYTPKFYYNNNLLLSYLKNNHIKQLHNILYNENSSSKNFWAKFSEKATEVLQSLKYSNEFLNFLVILGSISLKALDLFRQNLADINVRTIRSISDDVINNPDLCYENVVCFKRLLDTLHYKGCIVGSTLNRNHCKIETYDDIYNKISNIKQKNAVAKYVKAYIPVPKFSPIIVALIPTGSDDNIAADLELHIISIGSDGTAAEFQAQNLLQATKTKYWKFSTSQLEDFWKEDLNLEIANNNEYNTDSSLSVSHCINNAISEMNRNQEVNSDLEPELPLENLYILSEFTMNNDLLNIEFLLNLRQHHDAYSEKTLE
ncbi:43349_t:CDS:2 [Gigaspora margarita]|uniref:43349_t:CDS:1 n=1 Tax=Gigaspora margarita TaxID=4874 RepID=A0ABN7VI69_GIGMA|nr:43349_t:CDS:2 [Gigaspora margarita]